MKIMCLVDENKTVVGRIVYDENLPPEKQWQCPSHLTMVEDVHEQAHVGDDYDDIKDEFRRKDGKGNQVYKRSEKFTDDK